MKKMIFSLAAMAALTAAAPALADNYHYGNRDYGYADYGYADHGYRAHHARTSGWMRSVESHARQLANEVRQARYNGRISRNLANSIDGQINAAVATAYRYQRDGLSRSEVYATERRFQEQAMRLDRAVRLNSAMRYGAGYRYGYGW